ncbi:MAG: carbamoyl-phosphate synthase large subunit [Phycisphaerae bacterium]|nr:carbamoyl-phosphate synthase large subunit [Phycisphaerae bacterium]NUQ46576.1 carbamoyl-phosphate synthase large subunit [Phycisphaerae bacterium]
MPRDPEIHSILIIGSGPIIIGQGCEFDYSGTQACKVLRQEGYRVVLLNSNPATIMTDPEVADRTYIEPIVPEMIEKILIAEKARGTPVNALLPTLGGQTGLNCAMAAAEAGVLERHNVRLIGASRETIRKAEDRTAFKEAMLRIGLDVPRSDVAHTPAEALRVLEHIGLPCVIRPAYTLGGSGSGLATTREEFETIAARGLQLSRISEILIEESVYGWKEYELEVIRDRHDNVIIVCSIENIDPMGVHTGDSITVAPAQTLTDREYQRMRDSAKAIMREIGVECGGSNVQFAVDPKSGRQVVIEMNPRVSRSSALASKATGYPIAKVAAKLAVGYTLDEIPNDITGSTPASFEPTIDYVVVKMPRWAFEKFTEADETLTTQMKSVGEAMAIGRTFKEAFQKCVRSMEIQRSGYGLDRNDSWLRAAHQRHDEGQPDAYRSLRERQTAPPDLQTESFILGSRAGEAPADVEETSASRWPVRREVLHDKLARPCQGRPYYIRYAFKLGWTVDQVHELSRIDPWFLDQMQQLVQFEDELLTRRHELFAQGDGRLKPTPTGRQMLRSAKQLGYTDAQLAHALKVPLEDMTAVVNSVARPGFRLVDTCAAEFESRTPYYYAAYDPPLIRVGDDGAHEINEDELRVPPEPHVIVLGGGPNRIGQGIEFDYCCVHASLAARAMGFRTVMINSNPETVSTDYDTSDVLFFDPLTHEDVLRAIRRIQEQTEVRGVIVQFGGQTPLNLAEDLHAAGVPIAGTPPQSIHLAEDRAEFQKILHELSLLQPPSAIAHDLDEARRCAESLGYPVLIRPSYVLGGRAMELCNNVEDLDKFAVRAFEASDRVAAGGARHTVLIDKFLLDAMELDVDAVADFRSVSDPRGECVVCGVMEHIEEAGIHSGDSSCVLPPYSLSPALIEEVERQTRLLAKRLGVCGLLNVQFAVQNQIVYVLEVNPRASRTVPFVSKATGVPWAKIATEVMLGRSLKDALWERGISRSPRPRLTALKAPVFPFDKFPGVDVVLGPEMRSTGEVMGVDESFGLAFAKAQIATGLSLPTYGNALVSVNDADKPRIVPIARELRELGFKIFSTIGTHRTLKAAGIDSVVVTKQAGEPQKFLLDLIEYGALDLLINTPIHKGAAWEEGRWRAAAAGRRLPLITTITGARAAVAAIRAMKGSRQATGLDVLNVRALQDYYN